MPGCRPPKKAKTRRTNYESFGLGVDQESGQKGVDTVDREHPTLIIDEADDLFYRKSDLRAIVNAG